VTVEGERHWWDGRWAWMVAGAAVLVAGGMSGWMLLSHKPSTKTAQITTEAGLYQRYAYIITTKEGQRDRTASFNPAVQSDDAVVVAALRGLMGTAYDEPVQDNLQPEVENVNDKNYVTFSADGAKTYFQLFKNSAGEVGSVSFWRDSTDKY
jgi:hypothetical protein